MSRLTAVNDQTSDSRSVKMASIPSKYVSIKFTRLLMITIGFWKVRTRREQLILRFCYAYMLIVLSMGIMVELLDLYHCRHDIYMATYVASSTVPLVAMLIKAITFTIRRKEILWLIDQCQKHFWYREYDVFGRQIMDDLDKKAILFICSYSILTYGTSIIYLLYAILESVGKAEEDRILPFAFRLMNIPTAKTPYYELLFVMEVLLCVHSGICFTCFDSFLCILSMHLCGQYKILQNQLKTLYEHNSSIEAYHKFKRHIVHHHFLITYANKLENVFCFPLMIQMLISSVVLCISGFQLLANNTVFLKKLLFVIYILSGLIQIFFITLSCNNIIQQSGAVGDAMYHCNWEGMSHSKFYQLKKDMIIVMLRSQRPCHMTAAKFFPISLDSFTKVLSATASYLALLRAMETDEQVQ